MSKSIEDIIIDDLHDACVVNNIAYVKHIVENNIQKYGIHFNNMVWLTAIYDYDELVKYFFEINKKYKIFGVSESNSALYYAIKNLNTELIQYIFNTNECDYNLSETMYNNLSNSVLTYNGKTSSDKITKIHDVIKIIFDNEDFLSNFISNSSFSNTTMYIKKYLYLEKHIDISDSKNSKLLSSILVDITKKDDLDLLNTILDQYDNIGEKITNYYNLIVNSVYYNNSENVLKKILEIMPDDASVEFDTILFMIDYRLELKPSFKCKESFFILLDDGRILPAIKRLINKLNTKLLNMILEYYELKTKDELISIFNFF